jgi:hypothetical protein
MAEAQKAAANWFPEDAFHEFPEMWEQCTEIRDWEHIAELNKEPYMPVIQDVADYGMYTMMSIGTGEIVFWYPWIVGEYADLVGLTKEERESRGNPISDQDIQNIYKKYPQLKAYDLTGYTWEEIQSLFPDFEFGMLRAYRSTLPRSPCLPLRCSSETWNLWTSACTCLTTIWLRTTSS